MPRLIIDGSALDMSDAKINLTLKNPMFEEVGSYSLPFTCPRTKRNEAILKLHNPAFHSNDNRIDAVIYIGPVPIYGELVITEVDDYNYETYFTTGNSHFRTKVKEVLLSDLEYTEEIAGNASLSFTEALTDAAESSYPTFNYTCFPMLVPEYHNVEVWDFYKIINRWSAHSSDSSKTKFYAATSYDLTTMFAPSFYLCFVIQKIFDYYGYTIETNEIYADAELRTLVVVNFNTQGIKDDTLRQYDLTFAGALPKIGILEFIEQIENLLNVTFFISEISKIVNIKKNTSIISSIPVKDLKLKSRRMTIENPLNGFQLSYTNEPGDTFSEIKDITGLSISITCDNKEDLASYDAVDYKNKLCRIQNNDLYYLSQLTDSTTETWEWVAYTMDFFSYKDGLGELNIETKANPVLTDNDWVYSYDPSGGAKEHALYPRVDKSLIDSDGNKEYKTFDTLRLLFYRGIVESGGLYSDPDTRDKVYPLASSDVYKALGLTSPWGYGREKIPSANMSLRWGGTYGLYNTHWKDYLYWYINLRKAATDVYELSLAEIFSINFFQKYRADGMSVLFRSMELEIDFVNGDVSAGKCEVYLT